MDREEASALRFESRLAQLKANHGIALSDIAPSEIAALVRACDLCQNPYSAVNAELCGDPVYGGGGAWLWPLTVGAAAWLEERASKWWRPGGLMHRWATLYALANARDADAFARLETKGAARAAVARCAMRFPLSRGELAYAMCRALGIDGGDEPPGSKNRSEELAEAAQTDFASLVASLEAHSGIGRGEWVWGRSLSYTCRAYVALWRYAAALGGEGGKAAKDELDHALGRLAEAEARIVRRVNREREALGSRTGA